METGEPLHSSLSQTAVPFETDDCESYFSQYEDYDHEHGDQCDPLDGPLRPSESGLAEIIAEDKQEGIEDYLMAFDSEESAGNVCKCGTNFVNRKEVKIILSINMYLVATTL